MTISAISARNNPVLQDIALGTQNLMTDFIAGKIFKSVVVEKNTGDILSFGSDHLRVLNTIRVDGNTNYLTMTVSKTEKWDLEYHELTAFITDKIADQWGLTNARINFTEMLMETLMIARESAAVTALTTAGNYAAANKTSGTGWSDYTSSTPRTDLIAGMEAVKTSCGRYPNVAIIASDVYTYLVNHPQIRDAVAYKGDSVISMEQLKSILFPHYAASQCEILIGQSVYNSAKKGQTAVGARAWSDVFVYAYINPNRDARVHQTSMCYSFNKGKDSVQVKTWKQPNFLETEENVTDNWQYDDVVMDYNCGYLITTAK